MTSEQEEARAIVIKGTSNQRVKVVARGPTGPLGT